jgi:N-acetylmuramoyl-L-alanine amidase
MPSRAAWLLGTGGLVLAAAIGAWATRGPRRLHPPVATQDPGRWPGEEARLQPVAGAFRPGVIKVALDPGHGAPNNRGNTSSYCVDEQDAMLVLAEELAERLEETGHIAVRLTRDPGQLVDYSARLDEATAWGADAFVSLHSDVRGKIDRWSPAPDQKCPIALDAPGFAVLYSDEGDAGLAARRLLLGRAAARRMREAGFLAYGGAEYAGIYAADDREGGVFVDRHALEQRIFVLRRAAMPSILVETHNAIDPREAARWTEPETLDAFASALAAAIGDAVTPRPGGT